MADIKIKQNRFRDVAWFPTEEVSIVVGGAGGIGSWTALLLSRAGFSPVVYDFDIVEEHNIGGQLFGFSHITMSKVEALANVIRTFSGEDLRYFEEKIEKESPTHKYFISAFDNMKARRDSFESWKEFFGQNTEDHPDAIFIDGRLTAEQMQIFCVTAKNMEEYEREYLFDDAEVEDAPCTLKQTSHAAAMIASHIVGFFTNHYANVKEGDDTRTVPFMWEYFIPIDLLTTNS